MIRLERTTQASSSVCDATLRLKCLCTNFIVGEVGKLLGEKWKELSAKEKEPYEKKAKTDKERYEREKAEYAGGVSAVVVPLCVLILTRRDRLLTRRMRTRTKCVASCLSLPCPSYMSLARTKPTRPFFHNIYVAGRMDSAWISLHPKMKWA